MTARYVPMRRARGALVIWFVAAAALGAISFDARRRDAARPSEPAAAAVALTGLPDLVLSSSARWIRHPSQAEPGAALSDLPGSLDTDPAGALVGPPREVLRVGGVDVRRRD